MYPELPQNTPSFGGYPTLQQATINQVAPNVILDEPNKEAKVAETLQLPQAPAGDMPYSASELNPSDFNFPLKVGDNERLRARLQSSWDQFGNWAMQSVLGEVLGQTVSGIGALYELPAAIGSELSGADADFNNSLIELGQELREYSKKEFPIYRLNPNESWDAGDFAWWAENGVSMSSSLGLLLPALGFTKLTGYLATKLGATLTQTGKTITSAAFMRNAENFQEASQVVKDVKDQTLGLFNSMTDEEFEQYKQITLNNLPELANKDRLQAAEYIASKAGWKNYANNASNIVFDLIQTASLYRALKTTGKVAATAATAEAEAAVSGSKALSQSAKMWLKAKPALTFIGEQGTEGIEEYVNYVSQQEGLEYGKALSTGKSSDNFVEALVKYADDPEAWEQAFWGFMGGMAFGGASEGIQKATQLVNKYSNPYADNQRVLEINNRVNKLKILGTQLDKINQGIDPKTNTKIQGTAEDIEAFKTKATDELISNTIYDMSLSANRHGNREGFENFVKSDAFRKVLTDLGITEDRAKELQNDAYSFTLDMNKSYDLYYNRLNKVNDHVRMILSGEINRNTAWSRNLRKNLDRIKKRESDLRTNDPGFKSDTYTKNAQAIENFIDKNATVLAIQELEDFLKVYDDTTVVGRTSKVKVQQRLTELNEQLKKLKEAQTEFEKDGQKVVDLMPVSANELAQLRSASILHDYKINELNDNNTAIVNQQKVAEKETEDQLKKAQQIYNDTAFNAYKNYIDNATTLEELEQFNTKFQQNLFNVDKFEQNKLDKDTRKRIKDYLNTRIQGRRVQQTSQNNRTPVNPPPQNNEFDEIINHINQYFSPTLLQNLQVTPANQNELEEILSDFIEDLNNITIDLADKVIPTELIANAVSAQSALKIVINSLQQKLNIQNATANQTTSQPFTPPVSNSEVLDSFKNTLSEVFELISAIRNQSAIDFEKYFALRAKFLKQATEILGINEGDEFAFNDLAMFIYHQLHSEQNPIFSTTMFAMVFGQIKAFYEFGATMTNDAGKALFKTPATQNLDEITFQHIINQYTQTQKEELPFVSSDMSEVNFFLSPIDRNLLESDGIIEVPKELEEVYNALLNEIKTGDTVQVSIDQDYAAKNYSFNEHKNNPNFVPIKVTWNGITIGHINTLQKDNFGNLAHISGGFYYAGRGNDVIDYIMKPEIKKGLENHWLDIQNYLKGNVDDVVQIELVEKFLNEIINQNNQNVLDVTDFTNPNVKKALDHLEQVLFFGRSRKEITEFDSDRFDKVMQSWKQKIVRDVTGIEQIRNAIAGNTNAVLTRTIGKKSIGSVIFSKDEQGNPIYRNLKDAVDTNKMILIHGQSVGENGYQVKVLSGNMDESKVALSTNSNAPLVGLYVLVPSANKDQNGKTIHIPVRLHQNLVGGIEENAKHDELLDYLVSEFTSIINDVRAKNADTKAFKNRLRPYILVNDGALWIHQEGRPYIRFTSFNENGVKQDVYINIYDKSASIRIGNEDSVNNHPENGDPALFETTLQRAIANMRRNVALAFNTNNTNETRYYYSGSFTAFNNKVYSSYEEYLLETGAIVTDLGSMINENGDHISHISPIGNSPLIINLSAENTTIANTAEPATATIRNTDVVEFAKQNQLNSIYDFVYEIANKLGITINNEIVDLGDTTIAQYKNSVITLTTTWTTLPKLEQSKQLVHEIIHGMIAKNIAKPEYALFVKRLKEFYESIKDQNVTDPTIKAIFEVIEAGVAAGNDRIYEELITYAFTNSVFAKYLSDLSTGETVNNVTKTAFDKLKEIILEIAQVIAKELGITKLDELNSIINEFIAPINNESNNNPTNINLHGLDEEIEDDEEGTGFNGDVKLSQVVDTLGLFKRDQIKEYNKAFKYWNQYKELFTNSKREADGLYDRLRKELGDIFYEPYQLKSGKYVIKVKKPKLEDVQTTFDKMWNELSEEPQRSYNALAEQEGYPQYSSVIDYQLISLELLKSNKGIVAFQKKDKFNWSLEKTLIELQIPKQQKQLILSLGVNSREEIITNLLANYSYTIEINTAKKFLKAANDTLYDPITGTPISTVVDDNINTQYYSNLTVPGGTNYTENEIAIPGVEIQEKPLYSQYLNTIFPYSKVKEIDNTLYISVLNQLEQENIIEKDCSGGKLKAKDGLRTKFTKGGKWKLIKDLKGYPTHKEGGVDLTIGKNGVSIKNGNTEFTAKHGLVIPKN